MTPLQQPWFDIIKLLIAALLGFVFGTSGNFLIYYVINRDKRLRLMEREGKRHKFWKDFFDTQAALPEAARYSARDMDEAIQTCRTELSRSYAEVMGHTGRADIYSRGLASLVVLVIIGTLWISTDGGLIIDLLSVGSKLPENMPSSAKFGFNLGIMIGLWQVFYGIIYRGIRDPLKRRFLDRQRQGLPLIG